MGDDKQTTKTPRDEQPIECDPDVNTPEWHRGYLDGNHGAKNDRDRYKDIQEWTNYHDGWLTGLADKVVENLDG